MTKQGSQDNIITYEHICDTTADMKNIDPKYITLGSTCVVVNGEGGLEMYIATSNKQWKSIAVSAQDSSSSDDTKRKSVTPLYNSSIAAGIVMEVIGIPEYVEDLTLYPEYNLTDSGWYVFSRIEGTTTPSTAIVGAAGYIITSDHIDVAIKFDTAATSKTVVIDWDGSVIDTFIFKATDLAIRNLDYRTTYYEYDLDDYMTWTYALTTDTNFTAYKTYYTLENGEYIKAEIIYGDTIPSNTYYTHSKVRFEGMARNVTYKTDSIIDCPIEIVLPNIEDNGYGAWFEFKLRYNGQYSATLIPENNEVQLANDNIVKQTEGINVLDLHYTFTGGVKTWRLINTHTGFANTRALASLTFRTPPTKTSYSSGDALDLTGASVVATYSDDTKHDVTDSCTFAPASGAALTTSDTTLTATYTYLSGHTTLEKTLSTSTPLTIS